jgi:hypothetical protein
MSISEMVNSTEFFMELLDNITCHPRFAVRPKGQIRHAKVVPRGDASMSEIQIVHEFRD